MKAQVINQIIRKKDIETILNYKAELEKLNGINNLSNNALIDLLLEFNLLLEKPFYKSITRNTLLKEKSKILKSKSFNQINKNEYMKLVELFMNDKLAESIRLKLNILLGSLNRKEMLEAIIDGEDLNKKINILVKYEVADADRLNLKKIIDKENSIFHKDNNKKKLKKIAHFGKSGFIILCILLTLFLGGGDISASTVEDSVKKLVSPYPQERKLSVRELQEDQRGTIQYMKSLNKKDTSEMVTILIQAVLDNHSETKAIAISTLGNMGPKAQEALPTMLKLIKSNSSSDRWNAAWALGMISEGDEAEVVEALTSLLHDGIPKVVSNAALALGTMGSKAKPALPSLKSKIDDRNVKHIIRKSIYTIQTNNPRLKEILKKELLLEDPAIKNRSPTFNPDEPPTMCMCSSEVV